MTLVQTSQLKVFIAEANSFHRETIKLFLETDLLCNVIGIADNEKNSIENYNIYCADIVLVDCENSVVNGYNIARKLKKHRNSSKIIALALNPESVFLTEMLMAGFSGCVFKNDIFNTLKQTMENVINGRVFFPDEIDV